MVRVGVILAGSLVAAALVALLLRVTIVALAGRTRATLDDVIVAAIRRPVFLSVLIVGLAWAANELPVGPVGASRIDAILGTLAALVWAGAAFRIAHALLEVMSRRAGATSIVQPRTMPVFEMLLKIAVVAAAAYAIFLFWDIDLTAWLASAGIVGIAVGFAAKDTLANFFSGIFIVADAPYKVGDFIVLEGQLRGQVTKIGIRSTRVLTRDDVEITIPNAVIGASKIINETGGPSPRQRLKISVEVAYGTDIERVRELLLGCVPGCQYVIATPAPQVRFRELGASGLRFELLVWIEDPIARGRTVDYINSRIYKTFAEQKIEIPYRKQDLYIKEMPEGSAPSALLAEER